MSSNKSLSIVLIDDGKLVLAQLEAMIAETDGVEVVATANAGAGAIRVVREPLAERVAAQGEAKVSIGEALIDEKRIAPSVSSRSSAVCFGPTQVGR